MGLGVKVCKIVLSKWTGVCNECINIQQILTNAKLNQAVIKSARIHRILSNVHVLLVTRKVIIDVLELMVKWF